MVFSFILCEQLHRGVNAKIPHKFAWLPDWYVLLKSRVWWWEQGGGSHGGG